MIPIDKTKYITDQCKKIEVIDKQITSKEIRYFEYVNFLNNLSTTSIANLNTIKNNLDIGVKYDLQKQKV